jgi:hypothetical protein
VVDHKPYFPAGHVVKFKKIGYIWQWKVEIGASFNIIVGIYKIKLCIDPFPAASVMICIS